MTTRSAVKADPSGADASPRGDGMSVGMMPSDTLSSASAPYPDILRSVAAPSPLSGTRPAGARRWPPPPSVPPPHTGVLVGEVKASALLAALCVAPPRGRLLGTATRPRPLDQEDRMPAVRGSTAATTGGSSQAADHVVSEYLATWSIADVFEEHNECL
mmetsp:Transcript_123723/g.355316  ORF Transcript_123723/g.355316 Transcript_123723/m.355316 type:complete len:159 (+) Transcript_123723:1-477(+)